MFNGKSERLNKRQEIFSVGLMFIITGLFVFFSVVINYKILLFTPIILVFSVAIGMGVSRRIFK